MQPQSKLLCTRFGTLHITEPRAADSAYGRVCGIFNTDMLFTDENRKPLQGDGKQINSYVQQLLMHAGGKKSE